MRSFIKFLHVIEHQMRPRTVHRLNLADDAFLEEKTPLAPAKNLCYSRFAFEGVIKRMADNSMVQEDLHCAAAGLESESTGPLTEAAHL